MSLEVLVSFYRHCGSKLEGDCCCFLVLCALIVLNSCHVLKVLFVLFCGINWSAGDVTVQESIPQARGSASVICFWCCCIFLEDCFSEIMATALNFWTSVGITTEKKSETTVFCIRCEMCVSGSFLYPVQPHQQIY